MWLRPTWIWLLKAHLRLRRGHWQTKYSCVLWNCISWISLPIYFLFGLISNIFHFEKHKFLFYSIHLLSIHFMKYFIESNSYIRLINATIFHNNMRTYWKNILTRIFLNSPSFSFPSMLKETCIIFLRRSSHDFFLRRNSHDFFLRRSSQVATSRLYCYSNDNTNQSQLPHF